MTGCYCRTLILTVLACTRVWAGVATYTNPVIDEVGPADPDVILHNGTYYLYCTGDNVSYHV